MMDIPLLDPSTWPIWLQVPTVIVGVWWFLKLITAPYWGPTA